MAKKSNVQMPSYADAVAEVEDILTRLRGEQIGVDELTAAVKRATELIARCKAQLHDVEAAVKAQLDEAREERS